jgi:hypothetical protein
MTLIEMRMRKKRRWMRRKMRRRRRRVWLSRPHHHPTARATPSKKHQVKMKAQALMMMKMMRRWPLCEEICQIHDEIGLLCKKEEVFTQEQG